MPLVPNPNPNPDPDPDPDPNRSLATSTLASRERRCDISLTLGHQPRPGTSLSDTGLALGAALP